MSSSPRKTKKTTVTRRIGRVVSKKGVQKKPSVPKRPRAIAAPKKAAPRFVAPAAPLPIVNAAIVPAPMPVLNAAPLPIFGGVAAPVLGDFEPIPAELMDTSMWEASKNPEEGILRLESKLLPETPVANIEICFSFDTTGSMSTFVDEVKEKMKDIIKWLTTDIPNIRISIIAHGDYCDYKKYVLKRIDLSNDPTAISEFIKTAEETFGGDKEECIELVMREAQNLNWTPTSAKALVIISDSIPHAPNEYFQIDWRHELNVLKGMGVKVYGVSCGKSNQEFFKDICEETGGAALELNRFNEISELISGLAYREAANLQAWQIENDGVNRDEEIQGKLVRMPSKQNNNNDDNELNTGDCFKIHEAIHSGQKSVEINGVNYDIAIGRAGCKFVRVGEQTFIEQNKDKNSKYSRMAIEGRKITWIIQRGNWGLIMGERRSEINQDEAIQQSGHSN